MGFLLAFLAFVLFAVMWVVGPQLILKLLKFLVLPIIGPYHCWMDICERRAKGEIGLFAAGFEMAWTIVICIFCWTMFVGVPIFVLAYRSGKF